MIGRAERVDHAEVGRYWDESTEVWTVLVRAGYDHHRDVPNTQPLSKCSPK